MQGGGSEAWGRSRWQRPGRAHRRGGSRASWSSRGTPTLVRMVRAKSPAQPQYTGMLVSFTPRHLRQICNEEQPW